MWRSGAPQRRAARGAFPGADAPTRCYAKCPCDCGQVLLLALPIARDPPHTVLSQSKGENAGYPKGRRLVRLAISISSSRPAFTPDLESEIARGQAILDRISEAIHPWSRSRASEDLQNPDSPIASLPHGILHNGSRVGDVALRPTRPKGHVAERRVAAPRSPRRLLRCRCTYALLCEVPCDCGQVLLLALPIARDPPHTGLSQSKGENAGYPKGRRLVRLAIGASTSRPALTPHLESEIARGQAILDRISEAIHPRSRSRASEDLQNPDSPIASLPHGILHNYNCMKFIIGKHGT